MRECQYLIRRDPDDLNKFDTCTVMIDDSQDWCEEHTLEWAAREQAWEEWNAKRIAELKADPWNAIKHCTRCGFEMPDAWDEDTYEKNGVFQSTDGHAADVTLSGGYAEFIDGEERIAKLCHKCGHELLQWLNYKNEHGAPFWHGHPLEDDDFCNGWTCEALDALKQGGTNE